MFDNKFPILKRTVKNFIKTGHLIYPHKRLWINHKQVKFCIKNQEFHGDVPNQKLRAKILDGNWDYDIKPIEEFEKYNVLYQRFCLNKSWSEIGVFKKREDGSNWDNYATRDSLKKRYENIDLIYEDVKSTGKLKSRYEVIKNWKYLFFERDGIIFHVDRNGQPIFAGSGWHRLCIALFLKVEKIPIQLGVIHPKGLKSLKHYRK